MKCFLPQFGTTSANLAAQLFIASEVVFIICICSSPPASDTTNLKCSLWPFSASLGPNYDLRPLQPSSFLSSPLVGQLQPSSLSCAAQVQLQSPRAHSKD